MNTPSPTRFRLSAAIMAVILVAGTSSSAAAQHIDDLAPETQSPVAPEADDNAIVVVGSRQNSSDAAGAFIETLLAETKNGRIARWDRRLCLTIEGGTAEHRRYFAGRITDIAAPLGLDVRTDSCAPSALIIFTNEPDRLLARVQEDRPNFYGSIAPDQRLAFQSSVAPVRWIAHSDVRGAQGETPMSFYIDPRMGGGVERPVPGARTVSSRLTDGVRMDLQSLLVLVDASRLEGVSNRSLSAYLTMVVLGNLRPDAGDVRQPSILRLFGGQSRDGTAGSGDLTDWDMAYLRSLYAGNWNTTADRQARRIEAAMVKSLENGTPEAGDPGE